MTKIFEIVHFIDLGIVNENLFCIEDTKENRRILADYHSLDVEDEEKENFVNGKIDELRDLSIAIRLKTYEEELERIKKETENLKRMYEDPIDITNLKSYI